MLPDGYVLEPLSLDHAPALAAAYDRNREHLAPWDPARPDRFFTVEGQADDVAHRLALDEGGLFRTWVLRHGHDVVGRAGLQNIVRGTMQGGTVGYWVDRDHLRRGLARAMVDFLAEQGLDMGLHRLEAGTMVENLASQRVLEACGFVRYGLVPQFLFLNGAWRDHVLYQRLLHDRPLT